MAFDYKKKSDYWDQKRKAATAPRRRVEISGSLPKKGLYDDEGERIALRAKSKSTNTRQSPGQRRIDIKKKEVARPRLATRRATFEVVPDAPAVEHDLDPIRAQERRKVSQKRLEREKRARRSSFRTVLFIIIGGVLLASLVGGIAVFLRSPYFTIQNYEVKGNRYITSEVVLSQIVSGPQVSLLSYNSASLEETLLGDPWIREVVVKKRLPSTLEIHVVERTPLAIVSMVGGESWVVSDDDVWLGLISRNGDIVHAVDPEGNQSPVELDSESIVTIEDVSPNQITYGAVTQLEEVLNAIEVLKGLDGELRKQVLAISAPEIALTKIVTNEHVEILVGAATDIQEKSKIALELLKEHTGLVTLINVRTLDKPTWRGLDTGSNQ